MGIFYFRVWEGEGVSGSRGEKKGSSPSKMMLRGQNGRGGKPSLFDGARAFSAIPLARIGKHECFLELGEEKQATKVEAGNEQRRVLD